MSLIKTEPSEDLDSSFQSDSLLNPTYSGNNSQVEEEQRIKQHDTNTKMCATVKIEQDKYESVLLNLLNPATSTVYTNLYEDHEIKEEMVISPTILQDNRGVSVNSNDTKMCATVKIEQDKYESVLLNLLNPATSTFYTNLYEDHEIKEEMVIGPTILQDNSSGVNCNGAIEESTKQKANITTILTIHKVKEKKREKCNICSKTFSDSSSLRRHIKRFHIGNYTFTCKTCKKIFNRKDYLANHKNLVHQKIKHNRNSLQYNIKTITCDVCQKEFQNHGNFLRHKSYHEFIENRNVLVCDFCGKGFINKNRLICHINTNHMAVTLPYLCVTCGKRYSMKQSLAKHLNSHTETDKFSCRFCMKYLRNKIYHRHHEKKCFDLVKKEITNPFCKRNIMNNTFTCLHQDCDGRMFFSLLSFSRHCKKCHNTNDISTPTDTCHSPQNRELDE